MPIVCLPPHAAATGRNGDAGGGLERRGGAGEIEGLDVQFHDNLLLIFCL